MIGRKTGHQVGSYSGSEKEHESRQPADAGPLFPTQRPRLHYAALAQTAQSRDASELAICRGWAPNHEKRRSSVLGGVFESLKRPWGRR